MQRADADPSCHGRMAGLRRIEPRILVEDGRSEAGSAIYYAGSAAGRSSTVLSSAFAMEEQKQQLFDICEMVQSNMAALLEQIGRIAHGIGQQRGEEGGTKAMELLSEYELGAWPIQVDVDSQVKLLARTLRQTIDSCNINEPRLSWLLAINKFQVKIEKMLDKLVSLVSVDMERVLRLRVRCNVTGLELKKESVEAIKQMQTDIRTHQ